LACDWIVLKKFHMAIEVDWVARLRTRPSEVCPSQLELQAFVRDPEAVSPAAFSHIIRGCTDCREKLQEMVLHPTADDLRQYLRQPDGVPEEILMHFAGCESCQRRAREIVDGE
jgi:hypothetical protein